MENFNQLQISMKLLQSTEDVRSAYYGTSTKSSKKINSRAPLAQDDQLVDYCMTKIVKKNRNQKPKEKKSKTVTKRMTILLQMFPTQRMLAGWSLKGTYQKVKMSKVMMNVQSSQTGPCDLLENTLLSALLLWELFRRIL
ncbi:hypothetical protein BDB00DRAFT_110021 [Zychaea mexicana]|uniref:uncharacterized protein n=1 Tax=Zychaea mexicana TaxID=64656 RepID=UPI0022FE3119|nr:uncharacterized protein BDB00DRAFT_110021 [Zychaea mexicana]KAI9484831.1 hypothetical protein BDB00DRAFT_110021 [Zychaea mexicana]